MCGDGFGLMGDYVTYLSQVAIIFLVNSYLCLNLDLCQEKYFSSTESQRTAKFYFSFVFLVYIYSNL